jgi:8-oxo-dGTP pyrophosphatase MutT (NUDIX family)
MLDRYAHCTFCGARFTPGQPWPRRCAACGETSYLNPKPVAVVLQPVVLQPAAAGLLVVRRGIPPAQARPALPGGYIDVGETWQEGAVRELAEETGLRATPSAVRLFDASSAPDGTLLIFGLLPPLASVPSFTGAETMGCDVIEKPTELAFELHTRAAERWFAAQ